MIRTPARLILILLLYMLCVGLLCTLIAYYTLREPRSSTPLRTRPPLVLRSPSV